MDFVSLIFPQHMIMVWPQLSSSLLLSLIDVMGNSIHFVLITQIFIGIYSNSLKIFEKQEIEKNIYKTQRFVWFDNKSIYTEL